MTHSALFRRMTAAATVALVSAPSAMADPADGYFDHHGMMGWGGWFFGPLTLLLVLALLIGAVVVITRLAGSNQGGSNQGGSPGAPQDRSLTILRERFARGEITREEFEAAKKVLD